MCDAGDKVVGVASQGDSAVRAFFSDVWSAIEVKEYPRYGVSDGRGDAWNESHNSPVIVEVALVHRAHMAFKIIKSKEACRALVESVIGDEGTRERLHTEVRPEMVEHMVSPLDALATIPE